MNHPIWDLPTRLFHWLLVTAFATSWLTYELGEIELHFYAGYSLLGLLIFRLIWGFVGSQHSRFADFIPSFKQLLDYLKAGTSPTPGHSPLGALSVIALLALLLAQVITGLFNADDEGSEGPYHNLLSGDWADRIGAWHELAFDGLLVLICLHLLAIAYYQLIKHQALIQTMFSGYKKGVKTKSPPVSTKRALFVLTISIAVVASIIYFAPEAQTTSYF